MKRKYLGIIYILVSAFCFALMNMFVRLSGDLPSIQKSFFRNFVALIVAVTIMIKKRESVSIKKGSMKYLFMRAAFGTVGLLCNFYAVDHLVLADASMLNKMSPFFAIIFSFFILKEKLTPVQGAAVVVAFGGCLLVVRPTISNIDLIPSLIGLCGGMGAGMAYTMVRKLGEMGTNGSLIVLFFSAFSCLVTLPFLIINYVSMTPVQWIFLLLAGLSATGGQFSITAAYFHAPAKEISVYDYSQIPFAALLGFIVFGQVSDLMSIAGYIVIISTAVFMFFYSRKKDSAV